MTDEGKPTVVEALSRVMGQVQSISKDSRNQSQNFNFRGIDAVMNAVGPALREHGVVVVPCGVEWQSENYSTAKGTAMKNVTLVVRFRFYGPAGDFIEACAAGEAADSGDKAVPKAHSVAYRTLLLQALCVPTDEPDPDSQSHERANTSQGGAQRPAGLVAATWPDWISRMTELGVSDPQEWLRQATMARHGVETLHNLTSEERQAMLVSANKVLEGVMAHETTAAESTLGFVDDDVPRELWAKVLDGAVLDGPTGDDIPFGEPDAS